MDMSHTIAPNLRARLGSTERGAILVEYALLLIFIAAVCIVVITAVGGNTSSRFANIGNSF